MVNYKWLWNRVVNAHRETGAQGDHDMNELATIETEDGQLHRVCFDNERTGSSIVEGELMTDVGWETIEYHYTDLIAEADAIAFAVDLLKTLYDREVSEIRLYPEITIQSIGSFLERIEVEGPAVSVNADLATVIDDRPTAPHEVA